MSNKIIGHIKNLPYDIQEIILEKHAARYNSYGKFMVEMFIQSRSIMNWHVNGKECEDGQDEYYYDSIPLIQVIYDAGTRKWYSPEYITHPFIYRGCQLTPFSIAYASKRVGVKEISAKKIQGLVSRVLKNKTYKNVISILETYKYETDEAKLKMLRKKNNGTLWQCAYDTHIRVQEIYKTFPIEYNKRWWMYISPDFSKPASKCHSVPTYMVHRHGFQVKDEEDAKYKWGLVRSFLERDGNVENVKKIA